ncbi:MAG: alpha/beta hydrolase [Chloroflexi bacterium]|nr:alpha/beta hydrolase [Chloroflexota bacterium]
MKLRLDDGVELFYTIDDYTDPWVKPETVVLHHGMAKSHRFWYRWVPLLARHYRVVRFDNRGMGQSDVPKPGYPFSLDGFANDLLQVLDKLELKQVHLIGETVGGTISLRFATLHQERLHTITTCTSPIQFVDPPHKGYEIIEKEGVEGWINRTTSMRLDPQIVDPAYAHWYASQMKATAAHVPVTFLRSAVNVDLRPLLPNVKTPALILAAERLAGEGLGDFRDSTRYLPNSRRVVFPGVSGFIQHILPEECARVWLDFAAGVKAGAKK